MLIGRNARGKRTETRLALQIAFVRHNFINIVTTLAYVPLQALSRKTASEKPLYPAVHALVFPTQIPTDLRLSLRGMDELSLVCAVLSAGDYRGLFKPICPCHRITASFRIT